MRACAIVSGLTFRSDIISSSKSPMFAPDVMQRMKRPRYLKKTISTTRMKIATSTHRIVLAFAASSTFIGRSPSTAVGPGALSRSDALPDGFLAPFLDDDAVALDPQHAHARAGREMLPARHDVDAPRPEARDPRRAQRGRGDSFLADQAGEPLLRRLAR